jgi:predicted metal-binding membrane protein
MMTMGWAPMMAAMMLPGAAPAIVRHARRREGVLVAPLFTGSYFAIWLLVGLGVWLLYRPPSTVAAAALIGAGAVYELSPLKRECRRRCRGRLRSGTRLGVACVGSSLGLMAVLVALDPMSLPLMVAVCAIASLQKEIPR